MTDTSYIISGGFFDSVDSDRLYSADDMNMPYKDLVNDGIYKESDGTTPGFAVTASGSMNVLVAPGRALIGGKWGANKEIQTIEVAGNTGGTARIDSIVLQCDRNLDVRAVQLVYRQGGASAPELLTSDGITEFRLANIRVAASASAISSGDITDTRGGTECPWVTSVFDPPDADYILTEYRTDLAGENRTVKAAIDSLQNAAQTGQPAVANQAADMRDTSLVYLYEGSEEGYDAGYLYHYSAVSDQWVRGAQYGASTVDTALSDSSTNAVQNRVVKAAVDQLTDDVTELNGRLTEQNTKFTSIAGKYYGIVSSASAATTKGISDLNDLENGSSVMLAWSTVSSDIANFPANFTLGAFVYTKTVVDARTETASNMVQYAIGTTGDIATRAKTGGNWKAWKYYASMDIYDSALRHYGYVYSASNVVAPYDDCNTLPKNGVYTYVGFDARGVVSNYPAEFTTGATIITFSGATNDYGNAQIAVETGTAFRIAFRILRQPTKWTPWSYIQSSNSQNMVDFSMFEDFGVIGDSFASGSTYHNGVWIDNGYPHSWGQVLARMTGSKCVNYSKGGLSTRTWLTDAKGLTLLLSNPAHQLYILALGINDATLTASAYLGDETDMDDPENHDTFYGNYAKIINSVRSHAPNAKIMIMEILGSAGDRPQFNVAVGKIAEHFSIPLIVPSKSYYMTAGIFWSTMSNGHPIAATYAGMAKALKGIIEDLIASSPTDYAVIPTSNYVE